MLTFHKFNLNPRGRRTGDCSTRALAAVTGLPYDECLKRQMEESLRSYYDPTSKQVMEKVLEELGWHKLKQPKKRDGSKYKVKELDQLIRPEYLAEGVLVTVANHHTAVKNTLIIDTWDCGDKCVGNYYVKSMY